MQSVNRALSHARRLAVLALATLLMLVGFHTPHASASTGNNQTTRITMVIDTTFNRNNTEKFRSVIAQLRQAAGYILHNDVYMTTGTAHPGGLIALELRDSYNLYWTTLYFNSQNLYLAGFRAQNGRAYILSDAGENSESEITREAAQVPVVLGFGGQYGSLRNASGTELTVLGLNEMASAMEILGRVPSPAEATGASQPYIARSILRFVSAFAESSRFPEYRDHFDLVFDGRNNAINAITSFMQALRTSWGQMSDWVRAYAQDPTTPPRSWLGVGTLANWADVSRLLRAVNGPPK
ncbi:ribosome-inactivating family protein [Streptomyces sp. NPDC094032]|uniref:ribosome-inactivating family protein n=1 Tax=Streptomyces sp. NPDC094032 TaxID=3155308 RepID=UPI0033198084